MLVKAREVSNSQADLALTLVNKAIHEIEATNNTAFDATAYNIRGYIRLEQNNYIIAIQDFEKAIEVNVINDEQLAYSYYHLGTVYLRINEFEKAIQTLTKAEQTYRTLNDDKWVQRTYTHLATASLMSHAYKDGEQYAKKALLMAEERVSTNDVIKASSILSRIYLDQNRIEDASTVIAKVEARFGEIEPELRLTFLLKKAYIASASATYDKLEGYYKEALQILEDNPTIDRRLLYKAHLNLGEYLHAIGQEQKAVEIWEMSLNHPNAKPGFYDPELSVIYEKLTDATGEAGNYKLSATYAKKNASICKANRELLTEVENRYASAQYLITRQDKIITASQKETTQAYLYGLYVVLGILLLGFGAWLYLRKRIKGYKHEIARQESRYIRKLRYVLQIYQTLRAIGGKGIAWVDDEDLQIIEDYIRENEHKVIQY